MFLIASQEMPVPSGSPYSFVRAPRAYTLVMSFKRKCVRQSRSISKLNVLEVSFRKIKRLIHVIILSFHCSHPAPGCHCEEHGNENTLLCYYSNTCLSKWTPLGALRRGTGSQSSVYAQTLTTDLEMVSVQYTGSSRSRACLSVVGRVVTWL